MNTKSAIAGEYTAPPAHGPRIAAVCGTTLDARATGSVQADDRGAFAQGEVHDLADLLRVRLAQRATEHREVLREDVDDPAADPAVSRDDAVPVGPLLLEPEIGRAVRDEPVELHERAVVEQYVQPLTRGEFPFAVLRLEPSGAAPELRLGATLLQQFELLAHAHVRER